MTRRRGRHLRPARSTVLLPVLLPALLLSGSLVAGCSGDAPVDDGLSPAQSVAAAVQRLDDTSGLTLTISTDDLPSGVTGLSGAEGQAAHPAAFDGTFDLSVSGFPATADVIAVDGATYARSALVLPDWTEIDPADYGAPDPVELLTPGQGFSGMLGALSGVTEGERTRGGADNDQILTAYSGTVAGDAVTGVIPSASGEFDVTLLLTDDGELRQVEATGAFYTDAEAMTYTIGFDDYGSTPVITAP